jgi:transcriptional regulator with XRE-family HTH domain
MNFINPINQQVGVVLKYLRKKRVEKEISQYEMANRLCVSQNTYFKIEKGKTKLDMFRFLQICRILDLDITEVMSEAKKIPY